MQNNIGMGEHSLSTPASFPISATSSVATPTSATGVQGQQMTSIPPLLTNNNNSNNVQQQQQSSSGPPPEGTQQFCLRWNSYPATVATQLATLRAAEDFVDVTLACDGRQLRAHKLVLSACSPYFMQLFKSTPCQHPVIFLKDVGFRQLVALLEFMYAGEVNVSQVELPALLRTAEALQVRGLADTTANNNNNNSCPPQQKPVYSPNYGQNIGQPVMTPNSNPSAQISQDQQHQQQTLCPAVEVPAQLPQQQQQQQQGLLNTPTVPPTSTSSNSSLPNINNNTSSVPIKIDRNSVGGLEVGKQNAEDEDSDSNDSNAFDMMDQMGEASIDDPTQLDDTGEIFPDDGVTFDVNESGLITDPLGENQSEEESSEEESDEDDGELKEFTYQSDTSFSQEGMVEPGGNANGENLAGPSGMVIPPGADHPGGPGMKDGSGGSGSGGVGGGSGGSGRNRLSRSLWPPGIPYHGPQQCPYCPRVLSNVGNWRKHVLTMHFAREKVYKCRHCSSAFRTQEYLQKHYVRVHNYPQKMTRRKYVEQT